MNAITLAAMKKNSAYLILLIVILLLLVIPYEERIALNMSTGSSYQVGYFCGIRIFQQGIENCISSTAAELGLLTQEEIVIVFSICKGNAIVRSRISSSSQSLYHGMLEACSSINQDVDERDYDSDLVATAKDDFANNWNKMKLNPRANP